MCKENKSKRSMLLLLLLSRKRATIFRKIIFVVLLCVGCVFGTAYYILKNLKIDAAVYQIPVRKYVSKRRYVEHRKFLLELRIENSSMLDVKLTDVTFELILNKDDEMFEMEVERVYFTDSNEEFEPLVLPSEGTEAVKITATFSAIDDTSLGGECSLDGSVYLHLSKGVIKMKPKITIKGGD
jgi:hypothetical protein